jgi:hypothetical protein
MPGGMRNKKDVGSMRVISQVWRNKGRIQTLEDTIKRLRLLVENCCNETTLYTSFSASTLTADSCGAPEPPITDRTLYHSGTGEYPVNGDIIYLDAAGTVPYLIISAADVYVADTSWLNTDESGARVAIQCK